MLLCQEQLFQKKELEKLDAIFEDLKLKLGEFHSNIIESFFLSSSEMKTLLKEF